LSKEDPTICGARTAHGPCPSKPEAGRTRCRLHGGAKGSGAPKGNQNALKHGLTTREQLARLKHANAVLRAVSRKQTARRRRRKKDYARATADLMVLID
jgi:glucans biosynthesis protein